MVNNNDEPASAPQPDRWYNLRLGSSFKDNSSTKFCTLRYEFKPASIDKSQPASLHKNKENRVTVEFHNNQPGKRNVSFQGSLEDYKDNDAVLFFDGETFRLERLHRAVKRLRHVRLPEEHAAAANMGPAPSVGTTVDSRSSPIGRMGKIQPLNKTTVLPAHVEVERIDIGETESPGPRSMNKITEFPSAAVNSSPMYPDPKSSELENLDILGDDDGETPNKATAGPPEHVGFDITIPNQNDTDDEIADVDVSDEADEGLNAAEALRAQANAAEEQQESDSSSGSASRSSSSSSGSGTSSSDSDGSDDDSASSGGDVDI